MKAKGSKGLIAGCTLRANSSNTRCWYSISVTNRAAWNNRSPYSKVVAEVAWYDVFRAALAGSASVVSMSATRRSCSEWNTW